MNEATDQAVIAEVIRRVYQEHARSPFPTYKSMASSMILDLEEAGFVIVRATADRR